ncbi:MAG: acyltransferase family protein [Planctomycetales bacterium]
MEPVLGQSKLDALTGLRYCAAMTVVISHVVGNISQLRSGLLGNLSAIGMPLFFTLSGFLMCYNYYADFAERRPGAWRRFYVARIARIYPVYLLALLLSFSFMGNFFHDLHDRPVQTLKCLGFCGTLTQSWVHWPVFADYMHPRTVTQAYLGVSWSVSTEVFFYATFPLVIPALRRVQKPATILSCVAGVWLTIAAFDLWYCRGIDRVFDVVTNHSKERWLLYLSPYLRIGEFWIGCLVGRLFQVMSPRAPSASERRWALGAMWCSAPLMLAFPGLVGRHWLADRLHFNVGLAPLCGLVVFCLSRYGSRAQALLGSRPLVLLGESSYCLFLLHPLAQSFYHSRARGEDELNQWYIQGFNHFAMFVVLHLLALGIYQFFELPLRSKIRNWLNPVPALQPAPAPVALPVVRRAA